MVIFVDKFEKFIVDKNTSILKAIKILEKTQFKIVLVVDNKKLKGIITDGDIRKSLLDNFSLEEKVEKIMNKKPKLVFNTHDHFFKSKKIINEQKYLHVPLVDKNKRILGLYMLDLIVNQKTEKTYFFILAGGKGERLRPITNNVPKPMIKISGKPILEHIIEKIKKEGFYNVFISVNYLSDQIKKYFKNGQKHKLEISYIEENKPLGTIGSLKLLDTQDSENVIVTNADVYTKANYRDVLDFHKKTKSDFTLVVKEFLNEIPYGVVKLKGNKLIKINEKPSSFEYINAGIYVVKSSAIKHIPKNKVYNSVELIEKLIAKNMKVRCYLSYEKWSDIGSKKELDKIKFEFGSDVSK
jgi:dTDP-glucose pyrophosphorylase